MKKIYLVLILLLSACNVTGRTSQPQSISTSNIQPTSSPAAILSNTSTPPPETKLSPTPTSPNTKTQLNPEVYPTLTPGEPITLSKLRMITENIGWGMDDADHILRTTDGGKTWKDVSPPEYGFGLGFAFDEDTAWAIPIWHMRVGEDGYAMNYDSTHIWRTSDGGLSWRSSESFSLERQFPKSPPSPVSSFIANIQFLDSQTGSLLMVVDAESHVTYGWQLFTTQDGGKTWIRINDSEQDGNPSSLYKIVFLNGKIGWGAGKNIGCCGSHEGWNATIHHTLDGGQTWTEAPIPPPDHLPESFTHYEIDCGSQDVYQITSAAFGVLTTCEIFDNSNYPRYSFYHLSPDSGQTFYTWPVNENLVEGVDFINSETGWQIVENPNGGYSLEHTIDSGNTWKTLQQLTWHGSLDFVNEKIGWAIALDGDVKTLVFTQDGGNTWIEIKPVVAK